MASFNDLMNHPKLSFVPQDDGSTHAIFKMNGWGSDVICRFWKVENPGRSDPFRFELEAIGGVGGTYSHVSEHGCKIAIVRHLISVGLIDIAEDNGHLDDRNRAELAQIEAARAEPIGRPKIGDFVIMPDGTRERCCNATKFGMQTASGGSFNVMRDGTAVFGGGLNKPRLWEYFKPTSGTERGRFWFFSHGIAGAGRAVICYLPCRVFRLEPFTMTEDQARAHPMAQHYANIWSEGHREHLAIIAKITAGEA